MGNEKLYELYHTAKQLKNKFGLGKYSFMNKKKNKAGRGEGVLP